jgi:hypothetical protein
MESSLVLVAEEFQSERRTIKKLAKAELEEIRRQVNESSQRLAKKTAEIKRIKRLAQHILDQRTEMEDDFIESLEVVKSEIVKSIQLKQEKYQKSLKVNPSSNLDDSFYHSALAKF